MDTNMINLNELTAAQIAELLTQVRKAEKEKKEEIAALPQFAFLLVMTEGQPVQWSGKAADEEAAKAAAIAHAESEGRKVFDMCKRPLPKTRGRKAEEAAAD